MNAILLELIEAHDDDSSLFHLIFLKAHYFCLEEMPLMIFFVYFPLYLAIFKSNPDEVAHIGIQNRIKTFE